MYIQYFNWPPVKHPSSYYDADSDMKYALIHIIMSLCDLNISKVKYNVNFMVYVFSKWWTHIKHLLSPEPSAVHIDV